MSEKSSTAIASKTKTASKRPAMYKVIILNDDFTPMEFVIEVLQRFFQKSLEEATQIMLSVHHSGSGIAGIYQYDIAETKVHQVHLYSREHEHPLRCDLQPE